MENNNKLKNTIIKDAVALFAITLVAGLILGLVYQVTKDPITAANLKAKQEAYKTVFQEAAVFEEVNDLTNAVNSSESFFAENNISGAVLTEALVAKDQNGELLGYVLSVTAKEGYAGDINMTLGIDVQGAITGLEVLSMSETAGLGAKCADEEFKNQYVGLNVDQLVVTKTGKKEDNEIDAISGATITTSAVTKAVNAGIAFIKQNGQTSEK